MTWYMYSTVHPMKYLESDVMQHKSTLKLVTSSLFLALSSIQISLFPILLCLSPFLSFLFSLPPLSLLSLLPRWRLCSREFMITTCSSL